MIGRRSQRVTLYLHAELLPALTVQGIDKIGYEPGRMVQRQQFVSQTTFHNTRSLDRAQLSRSS